MSKRQPHRLTGRAYKEAREDKLDAVARTSYGRRGPRLYWVVNTSTNRRGDKPVTQDEFLAYVGRNPSVAKQYQLHEVK